MEAPSMGSTRSGLIKLRLFQIGIFKLRHRQKWAWIIKMKIKTYVDKITVNRRHNWFPARSGRDFETKKIVWSLGSLCMWGIIKLMVWVHPLELDRVGGWWAKRLSVEPVARLNRPSSPLMILRTARLHFYFFSSRGIESANRSSNNLWRDTEWKMNEISWDFRSLRKVYAARNGWIFLWLR